MRILLACEFYYPSVGGVQEVMRQLAERFCEAGHEVIVATTNVKERQSRDFNGVHIEEFRVSGNLANGLQGEVERYQAYVLRQDYDVLMIKAAQQWTFDALTSILEKIARPKIFIPCGFSAWFDSRYADYYARMPGWLAAFDRLVFYASDYRDINLARKHSSNRISIVPNGADAREFNVEKDNGFRARLGIPEDAFVVLTVGSLTGFKGHAEVASAFELADFGRRHACLVLVGNAPRVEGGGGLARMVALYRIGGLTRIVKWFLRPLLAKVGLGRLLKSRTLKEAVEQINAKPERQALLVDLPRREVIQAYLNSDLFVFASHIEYSPLVLFEAAAAGLPFLSVPVGNAAEIAQWTGGGVICEASQDGKGDTRVDPAVLGKHIEGLAAQPEILTRLGAQGRRAWQERFTWDTIFRQYEKIFKECLQKGAA